MRFFFREQIIQSRLAAVDGNLDAMTTVTTVRYVTKPQVLNENDST